MRDLKKVSEHVRLNKIARELKIKTRTLLAQLPGAGIRRNLTFSSSVTVEEAAAFISSFCQREIAVDAPPPLKKPNIKRIKVVNSIEKERSSSVIHYGSEGATIQRKIIIPDKPHIPTKSVMVRREASLKRTKKVRVQIVQGGLPELGRH
jgi:hypothetical protein